MQPDKGYAGMFEHKPSGLYLTQYRAYDPVAGRWLSRDPIAERGGLNLYGYVDGDPVNFMDPEGLEAEHTKNARPSTEQKHQEGQARKARDSGGEKADNRRRSPSKRPPGVKGPWPRIIPGIPPFLCPLCDFMKSEPIPGPELC
ncbi:MAG: RHS repeat-associated core domain-containing protein [Burkholderiaceae bacterium]|nr:RHS repeat-associated core domain-containing protein [Burkholderiaceae bacterium]